MLVLSMGKDTLTDVFYDRNTGHFFAIAGCCYRKNRDHFSFLYYSQNCSSAAPSNHVVSSLPEIPCFEIFIKRARLKPSCISNLDVIFLPAVDKRLPHG